MATRALVLGILMAALTWPGCSDTIPAPTHTSAESQAADALQGMLVLAEQGDWDAYVDRFYGEQQKFESTADRDALVQRFQQQWGAIVLPVLRRAASLTPRIDGEKALFEDGDGAVFVLYRSEASGWGFHL